MTLPSGRDTRFRRAIVVILLAGITTLVLAMVRGFLVTILMAAIFSGLLYPLRRRVAARFGGRSAFASAVVVALFLLIVVGPMLGIVGLVAQQAIEVSQSVGPWLSDQLAGPARLDEILRGLPFYPLLAPYRAEILTKAAELVGSTGDFLFQRITSTTRNTIVFLFHFFLFLYTMYYLLKDGAPMLRRIREFLPLPDSDQELMLDKFVSVTRATLRGTLVIGVVQGTLAGLAFAAAGIDGALFWGTMMAGLSFIPGLGTAVVWVPAAAMLLLMGRTGAAVGLTLFCALVVGTIDNFLRPRLVGRDTRMHPLLILFSTIGGLAFFGFAGVVVGPILAALFVTAWDMFGASFRGPIARARGVDSAEAAPAVEQVS